MSSLGEISISVYDHYDALKVTTLDVIADPAVFPRLRFITEYTLKEFTDRTDHILQDYELIDLKGELRLSEHNDTVGTITWIGQRHQHKSRSSPREHRIELFCDLDPLRIGRIEQFRDGREPVFWIVLWPTFSGVGPFWNISCRPERIVIPRDKWIKILDGVGYGDFEIVEVARGSLDKELYSTSLSHLKEAQIRLNHGDYSGCLLNCRKALEAMIKATPKGKGKQYEAFEAVLVEQLGTDRADYLNGIISRVKKWTNIATHSREKPVEHTRDEALFILNSTRNLLHLAGGLS